MAVPQPTAPAEQPPPELPNMPDVSDTLSRYLRTFSLWCRSGFRDKLTSTAALPGILLTVYDATTGAPTVATVRLTIKSGTPPTIILTPVPVGSSQP